MLTVSDSHTYGFSEAMHGMRYSYMSSWLSDTTDGVVGPKDLELASKLAKLGGSHAKFRRCIDITCSITGPLYWWKQFDTYKVGTVALSTSTMHSLMDRPLTFADFEYTDMPNVVFEAQMEDVAVDVTPFELLKLDISYLNVLIEAYKIAKNAVDSSTSHERAEKVQADMRKLESACIKLLPEAYRQTRMVKLNYEVASHIWHDRHDHKLLEWHKFCDYLAGLPYAKELIICG